MASKILLLNLAATLGEPADPPLCPRSREEHAASLIYGQAEDQSYEAKIAQQRATAADRYAHAAEIVPVGEWPRAFVTKIIEKAHQQYKEAYLDASAPTAQREQWRETDERLLYTYVNAYESARAAGEPCLGEGEYAIVALAEVRSMSFSSAPPDVPVAESGPPIVPPAHPVPPVLHPETASTTSNLEPRGARLQRGSGFVIAGALVITTGAGLMIWGPAHYAWRESQVPPDSEIETDEDRQAIENYLDGGRTVRTTLLTVGAGFVIAGVTLLALGITKRRRLKHRQAAGVVAFQ